MRRPSTWVSPPWVIARHWITSSLPRRTSWTRLWRPPLRSPPSLHRGRLRRPLHRCTPGWALPQTPWLILPESLCVLERESWESPDFRFSRPVEFVPVIQALAKVLNFKPPATTSIQEDSQFSVWATASSRTVIVPTPWASDQVIQAATGTDDRRVIKEASSFGDSTLAKFFPLSEDDEALLKVLVLEEPPVTIFGFPLKRAKDPEAVRPRKARRVEETPLSPISPVTRKVPVVAVAKAEEAAPRKTPTLPTTPPSHPPLSPMLNDRSGPVGGRLRSFAHLWPLVTSDKFVLETVSRGYRIEFTAKPPTMSRVWWTETPKNPS